MGQQQSAPHAAPRVSPLSPRADQPLAAHTDADGFVALADARSRTRVFGHVARSRAFRRISAGSNARMRSQNADGQLGRAGVRAVEPSVLAVPALAAAGGAAHSLLVDDRCVALFVRVRVCVCVCVCCVFSACVLCVFCVCLRAERRGGVRRTRAWQHKSRIAAKGRARDGRGGEKKRRQ